MENNNEKVVFFKRRWVRNTLIGIGVGVVGLIAYGMLSKDDEDVSACECIEESESVEDNTYELEETNFETVEDDK
jgi:hypothetical protein